jgi:hypothetical protein
MSVMLSLEPSELAVSPASLDKGYSQGAICDARRRSVPFRLEERNGARRAAEPVSQVVIPRCRALRKSVPRPERRNS